MSVEVHCSGGKLLYPKSENDVRIKAIAISYEPHGLARGCSQYKGVQRIDGPYVLELVVKKIQITSDGMEFSTKSCDSFTLEDIGSTIFLAREEAEEKLKEMYN